MRHASVNEFMKESENRESRAGPNQKRWLPHSDKQWVVGGCGLTIKAHDDDDWLVGRPGKMAARKRGKFN